MIEVKTENGKCSIEMNGTGITLLAEAGIVVQSLRDAFKEHHLLGLFDKLLRDDDSPLYNDGIQETDEPEQEPEEEDPSTEDKIKRIIDLLENL